VSFPETFAAACDDYLCRAGVQRDKAGMSDADYAAFGEVIDLVNAKTERLYRGHLHQIGILP
jgi:hypothetical protein